MPSPKAVLHDIVAQGLDPKKAHTRIATTGTLATTPGQKSEVKLALRQLTEEKPAPVVEAMVEKKVEPVVVEPPKAEEVASIEPVKAEVTAPVAKPAKSKFEKKEAPKAETLEADKADDAKKA